LAADLQELASMHKLTIEGIIEIHCSKIYRIYMIGFLPGFAYMGTVDSRIVSPRKSKPRTNVPAGSVGIAGSQTGIYPFDSPGGWQLIGQTPLLLFDPTKENPTLLEPGDQVSFHTISLEEFHHLKNNQS
jgi:inhibitor of KinA